jgi:hypothetical protein
MEHPKNPPPAMTIEEVDFEFWMMDFGGLMRRRGNGISDG